MKQGSRAHDAFKKFLNSDRGESSEKITFSTRPLNQVLRDFVVDSRSATLVPPLRTILSSQPLSLEGLRHQNLRAGVELPAGIEGRGTIMHFVHGRFYLRRGNETANLSPHELLLVNPWFVPSGTPVRVMNTRGLIDENYVVRGFHNRSRSLVLQRQQSSGGYQTKLVEVGELLRWNNFFDSEAFLLENPALIPLGIKLGIGRGREGTLVGVKKRALIVDVGGSKTVLPLATAIALNRKILLGECDLVANEELRRLDHRFFSQVVGNGVQWEMFVHGLKIQVLLPEALDATPVLRMLNQWCQPLNEKAVGAVRFVEVDPGVSPRESPSGKIAAHSIGNKITFFRGEQYLEAGVFYHELGHNFAYQFYGSFCPPEEWQEARQEGSVSPYGDSQPDGREDFAEAVSGYLLAMLNGGDSVRSWIDRFRRRSLILERLLTRS